MKNNRPKISVIVPVYNVAKYLPQCLDSLILQLYDNLEIICINDGSKDNSLDILNEYAQKDARIKVISQENRGLSATRNRGVKEATGEWLTFIDSDDWVSLCLYQKFVDDINKCEKNIDIYIFDGFHFGEIDVENFHCVQQFWDMMNWQNFQRTPPVFKFAECINPFKGLVAAYLKIYRTEWYLKNNFQFAEGIIFEDILFHIQSGLKADNIYLNDDWLYCYRIHGSSILRTLKRNVFDIFKIMELLKQEFIKEGIFEKYKYLFFNEQYFQYDEKLKYCPPELKTEFLQKAKNELIITASELDENIYNQSPDISRYYSLMSTPI